MRKLALLVLSFIFLQTSAFGSQQTLVKTDTLSVGFTHGDVRSLMDANADKSNGNFDELYAENIDVTDYGAVAGDGIDDLAAFNAAVVVAVISTEKKVIHIPGGVYDLSGTWQVPNGISPIGDPGATELRTMAGGVYVGNFLVRTNRTAADYGQDDSDTTRQGQVFKDIKLSNVNAESSHNYGIYVGDRRALIGLTFQYFWKAIAWTTEYTDGKYISRCSIYMSKSDGTDGYMVDMGSMGDGLRIDTLNLGYRNDGSVAESDRYALRINASLGGILENSIINGQLYVLKSGGVTIQNCHFELGGILDRGGDFPPIWLDSNKNVVFRDSYIMVGTTLGLKITRDSQTAKGSVVLENLTFNHVINNDYVTDNSGDDISIVGQSVELRNVFRSYTSDTITQSAATGVTVLDGQTGLPLTEFNDRSYILSRHSYIKYNDVVDYFSVIEGSYGSPGDIISALSTVSSVKWYEPTGVYYYRAAVVYDSVRMLGYVGANEFSTPLTLNSNGTYFSVSFTGDYNLPLTLRVYRGSASNVYEKYVDIPIIYAAEFYDNGRTLNGYSWQENINAGDIVDYFNDLNRRLEMTKDRIIAYVTTPAAPTYGTWNQGDEIRDISPADGITNSVVCVNSGTPGTWNTMVGIPATGSINYDNSGVLEVDDEYRATGTIPAVKFNETDGTLDSSMYLNAGLLTFSSLAQPYGSTTTSPFKIDLSASTDSWNFQADSDLYMPDGAITIGDTAGTANGTIKWNGSDFQFRDGAWKILRFSEYANIYTQGNATATTIAAATTWYQITVFDADGPESGLDGDNTSDDITTITTRDYLITVSGSFSGGASNEYEIQVFTNNGTVAVPSVYVSRMLNASGDVGAFSATGLVSLTAADTVEVWVQNLTAGADALFTELSLSAQGL